MRKFSFCANAVLYEKTFWQNLIFAPFSFLQLIASLGDSAKKKIPYFWSHDVLPGLVFWQCGSSVSRPPLKDIVVMMALESEKKATF